MLFLYKIARVGPYHRQMMLARLIVLPAIEILKQSHGMDEATPDNLRRPLVRRAPYMYDDDLLREEMAQYVERPAVRRSSRYLRPSLLIILIAKIYFSLFTA